MEFESEKLFFAGGASHAFRRDIIKRKDSLGSQDNIKTLQEHCVNMGRQ